MTAREIQGHLEEMYGAEVSLTLISSVTDAVIDEVKAWQARPLDARTSNLLPQSRQHRTAMQRTTARLVKNAWLFNTSPTTHGWLGVR